jgi:hypothetical protein
MILLSGGTENELRHDRTNRPTGDECHTTRAHKVGEQSHEGADSRAHNGEHNPFCHLFARRLRFGSLFGLARDKDLLIGAGQLQTFPDLQLLLGWIRGQAMHPFLLTLYLLNQDRIAFFFFLDLALFFLPGVNSLGKCHKSIGNGQEEYEQKCETGERRFHATIVPGT